MSKSILRQLDADIAAAEERLRSLRAARDVIAGYTSDEEYAVIPQGSAPLTEAIETLLLNDGAMEGGLIFDRIRQLGYETTRNTLYTTLSRLKRVDRLTTEAGKWDLAPKRRRLLSK